MRNMLRIFSYNILLFGFILVAGCGPSSVKSLKSESDKTDQPHQEGILQGKAPTAEVATSTVAIYNTQSTELCSAVIVSENAALTAAHCTTNDFKTLIVIFGTKIKKGESTARKVVSVAIPQKRILNKFNDQDTADLALVFFEGEMPGNYEPANFVFNEKQFLKGQVISVAGFGVTNGSTMIGAGTLRESQVVISTQLGKSEFLIDQTTGYGACQGDSGGPALADNGTTKLVWGIISRGHQDDSMNCQRQAVVTSIVPYLDWINERLSNVQ